jgi:hypothetical protein
MLRFLQSIDRSGALQLGWAAHRYLAIKVLGHQGSRVVIPKIATNGSGAAATVERPRHTDCQRALRVSRDWPRMFALSDRGRQGAQLTCQTEQLPWTATSRPIPQSHSPAGPFRTRTIQRNIHTMTQDSPARCCTDAVVRVPSSGELQRQDSVSSTGVASIPSRPRLEQPPGYLVLAAACGLIT